MSRNVYVSDRDKHAANSVNSGMLKKICKQKYTCNKNASSKKLRNHSNKVEANLKNHKKNVITKNKTKNAAEIQNTTTQINDGKKKINASSHH